MFHKVKSVSPFGVGWMSDRNGARRRTASRGAAPHLGTFVSKYKKAPRRHKAAQTHEVTYSFMYCLISLP